jgi:Holliday junction resolvase RusA-like endonuclease
MEFCIKGQPFSKANSRRLVRRGNRTISIKSEKALQYEEAALWQLKTIVGRRKPFTVPVAVEMTIYYPDKRQDLDPSLILDILQKAGVYENDRQVQEMHLFRSIDKLNPRTDIAIWKINEDN